MANDTMNISTATAVPPGWIVIGNTQMPDGSPGYILAKAGSVSGTPGALTGYVATPAQSQPEPAQAAVAATQASADQQYAKAKALVGLTGDPYNVDQFEALLRQSGVDVQSLPAGVVDGFANGQMSRAEQEQSLHFLLDPNSPQSWVNQYPLDMGAYSQAVKGYGLGNVTPQDFAIAGPKTMTSTDAAEGPRQTAVAAPTRYKNYIVKNDVLYYRNGVIADPIRGLTYPMDKKVEGSPLWMINAQKSWTADQVSNWRAELHRLGYSVGKKGGWDDSLSAATKEYYNSRYANGGQVIPNSATPGGAGPTRTPPLDLHQLTASIQNQVQQQYQSVFGQDPSAAELKSWTSFVINTGMQLQQGGPKTSLSPDAALNEAQARAARQITTSPAGAMEIDQNKENTQLHDALTTAIGAVRGL